VLFDAVSILPSDDGSAKQAPLPAAAPDYPRAPLSA
jgi:hypothetical protein